MSFPLEEGDTGAVFWPPLCPPVPPTVTPVGLDKGGDVSGPQTGAQRWADWHNAMLVVGLGWTPQDALPRYVTEALRLADAEQAELRAKVARVDELRHELEVEAVHGHPDQRANAREFLRRLRPALMGGDDA